MVRSRGSTSGRAATGIRDHCAMLNRGRIGTVGTELTRQESQRAGSSALLDPRVTRIKCRCHLPTMAGHDPQVVEGIARRSDDRVVARLDDGNVPVTHHEYVVGWIPLAVVPELHAEAAGRIELEVVDLFELNFVRGIVLVMLVRRIGRPVARRVDRLTDDEPSGRVLGPKNRAHLPRPVTVTDLRYSVVSWPDDAGSRGGLIG